MAIGGLNKLVIEIPGIAFLYQLDVDAPNAKDDEITLEHNDSDWKEVIKVADLQEVDDDWVELFFTNPPQSGTFNLIQDPKDEEEPYFVFWDVPFEELNNQTPEAEEMDIIPDEQDAEENQEPNADESFTQG